MPPYFEKMISSPSSTSIWMYSPSSSRGPGPTARTRPRCGFSFAVSGSTMPLDVVSSSSRTSTIRRSPRGCRFMHLPPLRLCDTYWHSQPRVPGHTPARSGRKRACLQSCVCDPLQSAAAGGVLRRRRARPAAARSVVARGDPAGGQARGRLGAAEGAHRPGRAAEATALARWPRRPASRAGSSEARRRPLRLHAGGGERVFKVVSFFLCATRGGRLGDLAPSMEREVAEARWLPLADAPGCSRTRASARWRSKRVRWLEDEAL